MKKKFGQSTYFDLALLVILLISFLGIASQNAVFLSRDYVIGVVLKNAIEIGFMALPMTIIIITGGIDLSCGNIMVLSSMLGGMAAVKSGSIVGILVTLSVGVLCGLLNGIVITKVRVPAMITTLATMYLYLGIARGISKGDSVCSYGATSFLGNEMVLGIPIQIYFYIVVAIIFVMILQKSTYGRKIFAIGLNEGATRYSGINTDKVILLLILLSYKISSSKIDIHS